jgi:hypothetical protein
MTGKRVLLLFGILSVGLAGTHRSHALAESKTKTLPGRTSSVNRPKGARTAKTRWLGAPQAPAPISLFMLTKAPTVPPKARPPSPSSSPPPPSATVTWMERIDMPKIDIYWNVTVDEASLNSTVRGRPFLRRLDDTLDAQLPEFFHGILKDAIAPSLSSRVMLAGVTIIREQISNTSWPTLLRLSTQLVGTAQFRTSDNSRDDDVITTQEALAQVYADYFDNVTTGPLRACLHGILRNVTSSGNVTSVVVELNGEVAGTEGDEAGNHTGTSPSEDKGSTKKDRLIIYVSVALGVMLLVFVVLIPVGFVLWRRLRRQNLLIEEQLRAAGGESKPPVTPVRSRDRNRDDPNTPSTIHIPLFSISDVDSSTGSTSKSSAHENKPRNSDVFHDTSSLDDGAFRNVNAAYASGHWSQVASMASGSRGSWIPPQGASTTRFSGHASCSNSEGGNSADKASEHETLTRNSDAFYEPDSQGGDEGDDDELTFEGVASWAEVDLPTDVEEGAGGEVDCPTDGDDCPTDGEEGDSSFSGKKPDPPGPLMDENGIMLLYNLRRWRRPLPRAEETNDAGKAPSSLRVSKYNESSERKRADTTANNDSNGTSSAGIRNVTDGGTRDAEGQMGGSSEGEKGGFLSRFPFRRNQVAGPNGLTGKSDNYAEPISVTVSNLTQDLEVEVRMKGGILRLDSIEAGGADDVSLSTMRTPPTSNRSWEQQNDTLPH